MAGYDEAGLTDPRAAETEWRSADFELRINVLERRIAALEERIEREYAQFLEEETAAALRWTGGV